MDWRINRRRRDTSELRTERITDLAAGDRERISELERRVDALEKAMSLRPDNDKVAVPRAFGDLVDRVASLAEVVEGLEQASNTNINVAMAEGAESLATDVADLAATAMKMFSTIRMDMEALRRRVNQLDNEQSEIIHGLREFARA